MRNINYVDIPESKVDKLKQFVRGSLLGDGSIPKKDHKAKNYRMTFGQGYKQEQYLRWKHAFLETYLLETAICKNVAKSDRYKNGKCISYHFKSKAHPFFSIFRDLYYKDKRIINREDIIHMDEFALAIWYMDDGNVSNRKLRSSHIELNTQSFTPNDVNFLVELLLTKWSIKSARMTHSNIIRISVADCQKFLDIIKPYKIDCLSYKWVLNKQGELLESPITVCEDNQQPSLSRNTLEGSTTNSRIQTDNAEDSNGNTSALPLHSGKLDSIPGAFT